MNQNKPRRLVLLGSTGSIGTQTLDVVRGLSDNSPFTVETLAAHSNIKILEEQIREFRPRNAVVFDENAAKELKDRIRDTDVKVSAGMSGLCEAAAENDADIVLNSVVGMVGLMPTLSAVNAGKTVALANKETLVAGGSLVTKAAREKGVKILPVDSEHSAIFQCLQGMPASGKGLKKLILTASGGPFFGRTKDDLQNVTPSDALKHPNWSMGAKVTIDSATMMNKGLEVIEACWLFDMTPDDIDVVIHRESIVHSLIEYDDNSVIAQLGVPDMRIPIQYALTYPERYPSPVRELNLWECGKLTFYRPDTETFRCLPVCINAMKRGGIAPAAANGANEKAVELFLNGKISFNDIPVLVEAAVNNAPDRECKTVEDVLSADEAARRFVEESV